MEIYDGLRRKYPLLKGVEISKSGLETRFIRDTGCKRDYRHIDIAQAYQKERGVGKALNLVV